jgi:hypothetical protein
MPVTRAIIFNHDSSSGKKLIAVAINGERDPIIYLSVIVVWKEKSGTIDLVVLHRWRKFGYCGGASIRIQREQKN